jgi:hypothetical protein
VLIAPMRPLSAFNVDDREVVLRREVAHLVPLSEIPNWEDHCADLRCISYVDRAAVDAADRVASMTEQDTKILQAQLVHFFTRLVVPSDEFMKAN